MKYLSKKLLFYLYPVLGADVPCIVIKDLQYLLPDLSPAGRRSLIHWLKVQGYLDQVSKDEQQALFLTSAGRQQIELDLRLFSLDEPWGGEWQVIVFRKGPNTDKHFHLLRAETLKSGGIPISRGVYAFARSLPLALWVRCQQQYRDNVSVLTTSRWQLCEIRDVVNEYFSFTDLTNGYSGISREIDVLLGTINANKVLNYQSKADIYSLYTRFFAIICEDTGLVKHYFPQTPKWQGLLLCFHRLLNA